jgi:hypothetical protein
VERTSATSFINKEVGEANAFSALHEGAHRLSFAINRPAIDVIRHITTAMFGLLKHQTTTDNHDDFWAKFNAFNDKLEEILETSLLLEELRATLFALGSLEPGSQRKIINDIYPEGEENREAKIFRELNSLTGDRWLYAWFLTLAVEYLSLSDPLSAFEQEQNLLKKMNAHTRIVQWDKWLIDWRTLAEEAGLAELKEIADSLLRGVKDPQKLLKSYTPSAFLIGLPNNVIRIFCPDTMRLKLFLESMRQQLAYLEPLRSLNCPFKGQSQKCCGYGHYLQGIWAGIPNEYRHRLKPPSELCLK